MMLPMANKKVSVTGKYTSSTGLWRVTAARGGKKATARGPSMPRAHRAAIAALALMERISTEDGPIEDVSVVPVEGT